MRATGRRRGETYIEVSQSNELGRAGLDRLQLADHRVGRFFSGRQFTRGEAGLKFCFAALLDRSVFGLPEPGGIEPLVLFEIRPMAVQRFVRLTVDLAASSIYRLGQRRRRIGEYEQLQPDHGWF